MSVLVRAWRAMGSTIQVQVADEGPAARTFLETLPSQVEALETCLSRFRPASELMRFNAQAGTWVNVSDVLWEALRTARHMSLLTDGLFNPFVLNALTAIGYDRSFDTGLDSAHAAAAHAVPDWRCLKLDTAAQRARIPAHSALDLGGIGKGWAAQHLLQQSAISLPALMDFGGDIVAQGAPTGQAGWIVAIADPFAEAPLLHVRLRDQSIATSGTDYRRWRDSNGQVQHHLIDPRTGRPAQTDILTLSVIHPSIVYAEAYAKAGLLMGSQDGLNWLDEQWHTHALAVLADGSVLATSQFSSFIVQGVIS